MRRLIYGAMTAGMLVSLGHSQSLLDNASFRTMSLGGIHLYGVTAYSGYSTSPQAGGFGQLSSYNGTGQLGADENYGVSTSLGWQHHKERMDFSLFYSANYGGTVHYSDKAFSQSLNFSVSRPLSARWTLGVSASGSDLTTSQFIFQPSNLSVTSQSQASFDDLAASLGIGAFSSSQAASTLTAAPVAQSPARTLLLGDRILSYSAVATLNYAHSSRLNFHISSFTASGQHYGGDQGQVAGQNYVMPRSFGVSAGMGLTYMLSPRTQMGLDVESGRMLNRYQSGYSTTVSGSIGRKMGRHWFLGGHAGGSMNLLTKQTYGTARTNQVIEGASIGFQTYQHTLLGSYDRSGSDFYGFAVGTNTTESAAWTWHRPGSRWSVFTSFGQQQIRNTGYASLSGWVASGGIAQTLTSHMRMSMQYAYLSNAGNYLSNSSLSNNTNLAVQSVRVSFSWVPLAASH